MKIYIISLTGACERRGFQRRQMAALGVDGFSFFDAVAACDIGADIVAKHSGDYKRALHKTELACYYSQRALWRRVADSNAPALILEDDALLSRQTPAALPALAECGGADLINLETHGAKKRIARRRSALTAGVGIARVYQGRIGAAAYALYPAGAEKLLAREARGIAPSDVYITDCRSLVSYQTIPALAMQLGNCPHYGITPPLTAPSGIEKPKAKLSIRKLRYQLTRAARQAGSLRHPRRHVAVNAEDFSYL